MQGRLEASLESLASVPYSRAARKVSRLCLSDSQTDAKNSLVVSIYSQELPALASGTTSRKRAYADTEAVFSAAAADVVSPAMEVVASADAEDSAAVVAAVDAAVVLTQVAVA